MKTSKKLFLVLAGLFILLMLYISYDISTKTTYPGSRKNLKERIAPSDTTDRKQENNWYFQMIVRFGDRTPPGPLEGQRVPGNIKPYKSNLIRLLYLTKQPSWN